MKNKETVRPQHRVRESIGWCGLCCNYKDLEDRQDESRKKEGTAFFCWIPKLLGKRVVNTVHGECEIIWTTREKPDFMRVCAA